MEYHEFLGQVQHRASLASFEEATRAVRATLETLGERISGGEAGNLASQLPKEIGRYLEEACPTERFGLKEFFERVSRREGVDLPTAAYHARVVIEVVGQAVSSGVMAKVRAQLPAEYDPVFKAGGIGTSPQERSA